LAGLQWLAAATVLAYISRSMIDLVNLDPVNLRLALISAGVLGFRHGLDYDHIAAITDISSVQNKASDAMRFGLLYVDFLGGCNSRPGG
jgi:high-affinity nickel permease